jgi:hypothetical protein
MKMIHSFFKSSVFSGRSEHLIPSQDADAMDFLIHVINLRAARITSYACSCFLTILLHGSVQDRINHSVGSLSLKLCRGSELVL